MNVGLLVALGLASLVVLAASIFFVVHRFWRMEEEVNEAIARALAGEPVERANHEGRTGDTG